MTTLTTSTTYFDATTAIANPWSLLSRRIKLIGSQINTMMSVYTERRQMLKLTDQQLCDIGATRQQVIAESRRSFFDVPTR